MHARASSAVAMSSSNRLWSMAQYCSSSSPPRQDVEVLHAQRADAADQALHPAAVRRRCRRVEQPVAHLAQPRRVGPVGDRPAAPIFTAPPRSPVAAPRAAARGSARRSVAPAAPPRRAAGLRLARGVRLAVRADVRQLPAAQRTHRAVAHIQSSQRPGRSGRRRVPVLPLDCTISGGQGQGRPVSHGPRRKGRPEGGRDR